MLILSRPEFLSRFSDIADEEELSEGRTWNPESIDGFQVKYQWFICVSPITPAIKKRRAEYLHWCQRNLAGSVLCFSGGAAEEWWGFTEETDILLWTLRWC